MLNCFASLIVDMLSSAHSIEGRNVPSVHLRIANQTRFCAVLINMAHAWENDVLIRLCSILLFV